MSLSSFLSADKLERLASAIELVLQVFRAEAVEVQTELRMVLVIDEVILVLLSLDLIVRNPLLLHKERILVVLALEEFVVPIFEIHSNLNQLIGQLVVLKPVMGLSSLSKLLFCIHPIFNHFLLVGQEARSLIKCAQSMRIFNRIWLGSQQKVLHSLLNFLLDSEYVILWRCVLMRLGYI